MILFYIEKVDLDEFLNKALKARLTYHIVRHTLWIYLTEHVQRTEHDMVDPIPIDSSDWRVLSGLDCRSEDFKDVQKLALNEILFKLAELPSETVSVKRSKTKDEKKEEE